MTRSLRSTPSLAVMYEALDADRNTRVTIFVNGIERVGFFDPEDLDGKYARFHFSRSEDASESEPVHMVCLADISEITFASGTAKPRRLPVELEYDTRLYKGGC